MSARATLAADLMRTMEEAVNKPNAKFPHAFIVLRIDDFQGDSAVDNKISAVATYLDEDRARDEALRLNRLVAGGGSRYQVLISRLKG